MHQPMILPWQQKPNSLCIGIAGCAGTGKEALANEIHAFADVPVVPDGIKGYMENNKIIPGTMGNRHLLKMYMSVFNEKKAIEQAATRFVANGTSLDYVSAMLTMMGGNNDFDNQLDRFMQDCGVHACMVYDIIFLMPYIREQKGKDVSRATHHMLVTQGAMESQPLVLMHPIQAETPEDQAAEALGIIDRVTEVKANVGANQKGTLNPQKPVKVRAN